MKAKNSTKEGIAVFREMRRKNQCLSPSEAEEILQKNTAGTLSVMGDDGYPYGVPVSYYYRDNTIYFHSALQGHKIDAIKKDPRVSFCVIDQDHIVAEKLTTYFRSVIAFGKAKIMENCPEREDALLAFSLKYAPNLPKSRIKEEMEKAGKAMCMVAIDIESMTGKEAIELVRAKNTTEKTIKSL